MKRTTLILATAFFLCALTASAQVVINDLRADRNQFGDVVLSWVSPQGVIVSKYTVWRMEGTTSWLQIAELHSSTAQSYTDAYVNLTPNSHYVYYVQAMDITGGIGGSSIDITVTPPPSALVFDTTAPTTVNIGELYFYSPRILGVGSQKEIDFSFMTMPAGMDMFFLADGTPRVTWTPTTAGAFAVTILARHKQTGARAVQDFTVLVASQSGSVKGHVYSVLDGLPVHGAIVRVNQVRNGMMYEVETDTSGAFVLPSVQTGELYAYCFAPGTSFAPQWYPLGRTLMEVGPRVLYQHDTLVYDFHLLPLVSTSMQVSGVVRSQSGVTVQGASVSFVRKNNYFHIGDTTLISNPGFYQKFGFDTTVYTDANGEYHAWLPAGTEFYPIVSGTAFLSTFSSDRSSAIATNALESRPFIVGGSLGSLDFTLYPETQTSNVLSGYVTNLNTAVSKQSVVVLIDAEMKRGAGGGHTYRRYRSTVSDVNGRYQFDNLPLTTAYSVLAIPFDREIAPQYFDGNAGTSTFMQSADIVPNGTIDIPFKLPSINSSGVGTIYGRVMVRLGTELVPASGTLLFAKNTSTGTVVGYAVSDSAGWYSMTAVPAGSYRVHLDHPAYGTAPEALTSLSYQSTFNLVDATRQVNFVLGLTSVNPASSVDGFTLLQNYPNPFNPSTSIRFTLPRAARVTLRVLDALGRVQSVIHDGMLEAGDHGMEFDGTSIPSGTYFYQLQSGSTILTRSMMLMK